MARKHYLSFNKLTLPKEEIFSFLFFFSLPNTRKQALNYYWISWLKQSACVMQLCIWKSYLQEFAYSESAEGTLQSINTLGYRVWKVCSFVQAAGSITVNMLEWVCRNKLILQWCCHFVLRCSLDRPVAFSLILFFTRNIQGVLRSWTKVSEEVNFSSPFSWIL